MTRESDLYKDKIEVSLDGRQIFYLFFGGAVIVGLVFVLGVMVGRRVEARGHLDHAQTQTAADPLAALDRLEGNRGMTFQSRLTGSAAPPSEVEQTIAELEKNKAEAKKSDKKPEAKKPEVKPEPKPEPKPEAKPEPKPEKKPDPAKPKKHDDVAAAKPEDKPKFTLQLSSFQDKAEADAFLSTIKAAGYQPYVTEAAVDGKGTFYRVRIGSYRTVEAANNAKTELDKTLKKPAQVTKL